MADKVIVAIHGMGDQVRCETIQLVVRQFARYYGVAEGVPLGHLNTVLVPTKDDPPPIELALLKDANGNLDVKLAPAVVAARGPGAYLVTSPPFSDTNPIGFAEVYWADIPRTVAKDRYQLDEAKKWARTVVERARNMAAGRRVALAAAHTEAKAAHTKAKTEATSQQVHNVERLQASLPDDTDFDLAADVITEMIETVSILGVLLYLLNKVGLVTFNLDKVLVDYLGDVQVVAEFNNFRRKIVDVVHSVMKTVHEKEPTAEIYIIAHSEGTVVALLGILEALCGPPTDGKKVGETAPSPWTKRLRGLMTIGSPLNKHMVLWPELFEDLRPQAGDPGLGTTIKWVNYFDYGDPVGFRLTKTEEWMGAQQWVPHFFAPIKDIGFSRYIVAGKAHIDYWEDEGLFTHFLYTVVGNRVPPPPAPAIDAKAKTADRFEKQPNRLLARVFSPALPYLWAALLLFAGVYFLYSAVTDYCLPFTESAREVAWNVLGIGLLLGGVTVAVRIPRLTKNWLWRGTGVVLLLASGVALPFLLTESAKFRLGSVFLAVKGYPFAKEFLTLCDTVAAWCRPHFPMTGTTLAFLAAAFFAAVVVSVLSWLRPHRGTWPLIGGGALVISSIVLFRMIDTTVYPRFEKARAAFAKGGISGNTGDALAIEAVNHCASSPNVELCLQTTVLQKFDALAANNQADLNLRPEVNKVLDAPDEAVEEANTSPLWPVIVGEPLFLCLWWLAAHVFDLIVVWQHYIRSSAILDRLNEMRAIPSRNNGGPSGGPIPAIERHAGSD